MSEAGGNDPLRIESRCCSQRVPDERPAGQRMQHLGHGGLHAGSLSCCQDDHTQRSLPLHPADWTSATPTSWLKSGSPWKR